MRRNLMVLVLSMVAATFAFAHGGGGMMGGGRGMMGGSGMIVVADDGSLLVSSMDMSNLIAGGGPSTTDRELVNVDANGNERWRVSFTEGWPMMSTTDGDLVIVALVDDWFMGDGGMGDGGMGGGAKDADHGGSGGDETTLVALDTVTGQERWRVTIAAEMASMVQFSPDGAQIYVSAREMGSGGGMGHDPIGQGDAAGSGFITTSTIIAFDRDGVELWTFELNPTGAR
ncbi:MAG: PQQ-binding-like beta-propeller repeat protein [Thermoanaerobaculales bacterium]